VVATVAAAGTYLGIDPRALMFAAVGATLTEPAAPSLGSWRTLWLFVAVTLVSGLFATLAAKALHDGDGGWAGAWGLGFGLGMQPLMAEFVKAIPALAAAVRDRAIRWISSLGGKA
jgi:hypothetical protein